MDSSLAFILPLGSFSLIYLAFFLRNPSHRMRLLSRFGLQQRNDQSSRDSKATKSHNASDKKEQPTTTSPSTYKDVLPPSRNFKTTTTPIDPIFIPLGAQWDKLTGKESTPTGFTVDEAKELVGSMPDYAKLSGVPLPEPVWDGFTIEKAQPRPYRPLRWSYHQTMSLTKLDPSYWLELECTYAERIKQRQKLVHNHGEHVLQCLPGAEQGCAELTEMVVQFLCARYPMYFSISNSKEQKILHNRILNTTTNLSVEEPLQILLKNVPEDFGLMQRNPDNGLYYLRAGMICSALGWSLGTKIGKPLAGVHEPVPDFKEKMQFSMDRYFAKMPTDAPIQRGSWGIEKGELLFSPPFSPYSDHLEEARANQEPDLSVKDLHFRVDWQTLRRLPVTGFIVFNFKALFTPVSHFREEPYVPALLRQVLMSGKSNIMEYKGTWAVEHVMLPELEKWVMEQEAKGLMEKGWNVETLKESPWFPGWVELWRKRMGISVEAEPGVGREK